VTIAQCSDQELLDLLRELAQDDDGSTQQNNIASQVMSSSQLLGISPSVISHISANSLSPQTVTPPWGADDTLTPDRGAENDTLKEANDLLTPSKEASCDTVRVGDDIPLHLKGTLSPKDESVHSFSLQSDSILFQDSQHSTSKEVGGTSYGVQLTVDQRAHVISLCSYGDEEDLQLDNTYHTSYDDSDIINNIIEHEDIVMSQPWNSEHHLEHQPQQ